ncbi:adenylate/guanylate cyclase domain-containing protein [Lyngbya aestuarii]|uniref:adenylate/guanylate cyclase domain-containing protein n=1 Tax=Lyngbya aestuarii TaxID=118322 RepID=UPI00403D9F95
MPYLISEPKTPDAKTHKLSFGTNSIGRDADNSIVVNHKSLSRKHAEIGITDTQAIIRDLHSLNHTFVNGVVIDHYELKDGDLIRCGGIVFQFVEALKNSGQDPLDLEETQISIVTCFSPEQTEIAMQNLLHQDLAVPSLAPPYVAQQAVTKLNTLLKVSQQLSSPEEPEKLLEKILDQLFKNMDVDRGAILLVNQATGVLERQAAKSKSGITADYNFYSKRITNLVAKNGDAIKTADACLDPQLKDSDSILKQGIHASMCVPLKKREVVIGVLYVDHLSLVNVYSDEDLVFLACLANQAAIAIENSRLYQQMQAEAVLLDKLERFFPESVSKKLREEGNLEIIDTEVTVLFCDISSFTEMSSQMEPRQLIEMLNEYFQIMVEEIVFPYEGTLEKYIGDALLAVWGAPYQRKNDVDQAVQAAIAMQWAVCRLNQEWAKRRNLEIKIHIGLNTGKVAAGNIGSKKLIQYAAIGDTTNVASRICSVAKADEILISQSTFNKLENRTLPLQKMAPVQVKGKDLPLQLYRLLWEQVQLLPT